ncbi:MAG TPA: biotin--[acetyl-CoA-carboxylase] ligase [Opitutales bacterium]|nr:biotin--[acetyl-CoA-carboxylase] ligase [Opitutales bacterium]
MPDTDVVILKALLQANSNFVSGNLLANELGISRVGVWARLEKLREEGFGVEAIRHRGYRLTEEPPTINENLVRAYLELGGSKVDFIFRGETGSTNTEAEKELASGRQTPFAVLAQKQTKGRGRMGREWRSQDTGNLYASFAFRPQLPPAQMQMITLWMGVQICRYINERLSLPAQIKWPNDILSGGKKLCGILAEARVDADRTRDLIFGIGINVNSDCSAWPAEVAAVATSLASVGNRQLKINLVAAELVEVVSRAYDRYISGDYVSEMFELWSRYDALSGLIVRGSKGPEEIVGTAKGIDEHGNLVLLLENGQTRKIHAGEVSIGTKNMSSFLPAAK